MKRIFAIITCLALLLTFIPAPAEEPAADKPSIGQRLDAWLEELNTLLDDTAAEIEKTAGDVSEWANGQWQDIQKEADEFAEWIRTKTDSIGKSAEESGRTALEWAEANWKALIEKSSEQTRSIGSKADEWWNSLNEGAKELFERIGNSWNELEGNVKEYSELIALGTRILIRESLLETVSLVEDLAAEHDAVIPENIRQILDAIKAYAEGPGAENTELRIDEEALTGFLKELGVDEAAFQAQMNDRFRVRLQKLGIEAENVSLGEMITAKGISFSSAALRAQDRLNRYAAGKLEMTEEEYNKALEIISSWAKDAGIDETELVRKTLEYMATK